MSTAWGYRCKTCCVDSPTWFNHGQELLCEAVARWPEIKAIRSASFQHFMCDLEPYAYQEHFDNEPTLWQFLEAHDGHDLMLQNEYGETVSIASMSAPSALPPQGGLNPKEDLGGSCKVP